MIEVNVGDGQVLPDTLFGTVHDGTPRAEEAMKRRLDERRNRAWHTHDVDEARGEKGAP